MSGDNNYAQQPTPPVLDPTAKDFFPEMEDLSPFPMSPFMGSHCPSLEPYFPQPQRYSNDWPCYPAPPQNTPTPLANPRNAMTMPESAVIANTPMQFPEAHSSGGHPAVYHDLVSPEGQSYTELQWPSAQFSSGIFNEHWSHLPTAPPAKRWNNSQQSLHSGGAAGALTDFNLGSAVDVSLGYDSAQHTRIPQGLGHHQIKTVLTQANMVPSRRRPRVQSTVQSVTEEMPGAHAT
jgi:hypothetical protein